MVKIIKQIVQLLDSHERKRLYVLLGAMIFSALIEVTGIASIMPFLSLLITPDIIHTNAFFSKLYSFLNFQSTNSFLIFIGMIVLILLVISNIVISSTLWFSLRFSWMRDYSISRRLLSRYLHQPYAFFLNLNTSELAKNILSEVAQVVHGIIIPVMQITAKGIITLFIFALLAAVDVALAIALIVAMGFTYTIIYKIVKQKLSFIGQQRFETNAARYKSLHEIFGGIKQIKLIGCEDLCVQRYAKPSFEYARHNALKEIIPQLPRYLLEIVAFGSVIIAILFLVAKGKNLTGVIPVIGLYVFAAYRVMPGLQQIFSGVTRVRFNLHALDVLCKDMASFQEDHAVPLESNKGVRPLMLQDHLRLEGITFTYPGATEPVICDLNLSINAHTSVAFVGTTGSGKTTIADILLGLLKPQKGLIFVDETEITDDTMLRWQRDLGYIPQDIYLEDATVAKNIAYGVLDANIDMEKVEHAAKIANIHNVVKEELSNGYDTIIGERGVRLSGGQRQRIGIARAMYNDPQVLVLDEATSALDGITEKAVFSAIENVASTKTLIIIAHRLATVRTCDIIYLLENGRIIDKGTYDELMETNTQFQKMAASHP